MLIFFSLFVIISCLLIPLAWLIGIYDKIRNKNYYSSNRDKLLKCWLFIPFGPLILLLDLFVDIYYFWKNNFKKELKYTIVVRKKQNVHH